MNDNWFIHADYSFRNKNYIQIDVKCLHLNENNRGSINKTNINALQTFIINDENKKFIINIILFMGQKTYETQNIADSVFTIANYSFKSTKYSDNQTYALSFNDITELALSTELEEYFHYGLSSKDYNFYSDGIFYGTNKNRKSKYSRLCFFNS